MARVFFYAITLSFACCAAEAQYSGPKELFGQDGRLFSVERSGSDVIKYFLLHKRPLQVSGGFDGKIRVETNIPGGGYKNDEIDFQVYCVESNERDYEPNVSLFDFVKKGSFKTPLEQVNRMSEWSFDYRVDKKLARPPRSEMKAYNLWWATCRGQFQKFK